jgi:uncharacterized protein (TIGR02145 family)/uncharacterized repeat protein (TIGR02543 family)
MAAVAAMIAATVGTVAAQKKYVAVVETEIDAQSGAAAKLNKAEVREITTVLRNETRNVLPLEKYLIMDWETIVRLGGATLEECTEENCIVTLGSKIGADYVVRGSVSKFGAKLTLSVMMYETENGTLVASTRVSSERPEDLLEKITVACAEMYRKFMGSVKTAITYTVTATASPAGGGAVSRSPDKASYNAGEQITITAVPADGYAFTGWSGSSNSKNATLTAPIDRNLTLTANFYKQSVVAPPAYQPPMQTPVPPKSNQLSYVDASGMLTDGRDGKKYKAVLIGGKRWMAENLNYQTMGGSWCYGDDNSNCNKYGRLYDWNTAKRACPSGWHLPSRQEWDDLVKASGGRKAGKKLKAKSGWNIGNGTDDFGFSALPGGFHRSGGGFINAGNGGNWWSATRIGSSNVYYRSMYYNSDYVGENYDVKSNGFSVRCRED